ncbi:aromatic ring-hydroxylating dioxygenase subunit alpha [Paenibacillus sp. WQ 127069]|uniref:Aromatic ring-hydroxylating dioxygenase subunit alpha n=1 Tax=Paenibacillus baimaensis TaxID=2982185 RepID=A0ABT2ULS8_9BACL|nr:aromatic ring-hydroxylating dioxygenase subunit alpha [Paenibacillus sp. WQ 127069]MCU6795599.1 aromatic ring-hydroxylating dioxygenase subunit alpha [Paenibacillus sp. WQ 127069]
MSMNPQLSAEPAQIQLPRDCTFTPNDWQVLSQYWFPVAIASDIADKPVGVTLLDVKLVCYRSHGKVIVARDLCFHRGAPLSKGWVENEEIVCPYHGFRYNCEGTCTSVPAHPNTKISPKLKLIVYPTVERYGLIWTSLSSTSEQIPDLPGWDDPDFINITLPSFDIAGSAGRQMEGFLDVSHFAYVHIETFGDRNNTEVPQYKVKREGDQLIADYWSTVSNYGKGQENIAEEGFMWLRAFRVFPPFAASLTVHFPNDGKLMILNCASPVSARYTRLFCPISRNFDKNAPVEDTIKFNLQVFQEDRDMVEAQTPEDLPLDLQAEAHIPADRTSIAYRQLLSEIGLGRSYTS